MWADPKVWEGKKVQTVLRLRQVRNRFLALGTYLPRVWLEYSAFWWSKKPQTPTSMCVMAGYTTSGMMTRSWENSYRLKLKLIWQNLITSFRFEKIQVITNINLPMSVDADFRDIQLLID